MFSIDTNIEFSYDATTLKKAFLESGGDMLMLQTNQDGSADINLYDEMFPFFENDSELVTEQMWSRLFKSPISSINIVIRKIISDDYDTESNDDINNGDIAIPIASADYNEADLKVMDTALFDAMVYGAVAEWYVNTDVEALIKLAKEKEAEAISKLSIVVKKIESVFLRKPLKSAIFDTMI